ncbi:helix-turn-helix transcriptional regulator [Oscillospiraceae bacterium 38-13]
MFGKKLRETRMARGLTQQKISDAVGLALRSYQCYEQGTREPPLDMLIKLADVLEVPTDYLLCRDLSLLKSFDGFQ